jgi:hypothetical protein
MARDTPNQEFLKSERPYRGVLSEIRSIFFRVIGERALQIAIS